MEHQDSAAPPAPAPAPAPRAALSFSLKPIAKKRVAPSAFANADDEDVIEEPPQKVRRTDEQPHAPSTESGVKRGGVTTPMVDEDVDHVKSSSHRRFSERPGESSTKVLLTTSNENRTAPEKGTTVDKMNQYFQTMMQKERQQEIANPSPKQNRRMPEKRKIQTKLGAVTLSDVQPPKALSTENKGHQMLLKMGWKEGTGLGMHNSGMVEPISVGYKVDVGGLGAAPQVKTGDDQYEQFKQRMMVSYRYRPPPGSR